MDRDVALEEPFVRLCRELRELDSLRQRGARGASAEDRHRAPLIEQAFARRARCLVPLGETGPAAAFGPWRAGAWRVALSPGRRPAASHGAGWPALAIGGAGAR